MRLLVSTARRLDLLGGGRLPLSISTALFSVTFWTLLPKVRAIENSGRLVILGDHLPGGSLLDCLLPVSSPRPARPPEKTRATPALDRRFAVLGACRGQVIAVCLRLATEYSTSEHFAGVSGSAVVALEEHDHIPDNDSLLSRMGTASAQKQPRALSSKLASQPAGHHRSPTLQQHRFANISNVSP